MSIDVSSFFYLFLMVQISLPHKRMGRTSALYMFILEIYGGNIAYKCCLECPLYEKMLLGLVEYFLIFIRNLLIIYFIKKESLTNCKLNKQNFTPIATTFVVFFKILLKLDAVKAAQRRLSPMYMRNSGSESVLHVP